VTITALDALLRQAEHASARGDGAAAEVAWRRVLQADPNHLEASFYLGNRDRERGQYSAAITHYERVLRAAPDHAGALNNLGLTYKASGQTERAESCFRAILAVQPQSTSALINLAHVLFQREQYREVIATCDRLFEHDRDPPRSIHLLRALTQEHLRDLPAAEASLRAAAKRWPSDATLHAYLGMSYVRQQRYVEAEPPLRRSVALAPSSAYALSMLAHARQHRCAWPELRELFAKIDTMLGTEGGEGLVPVEPFAALAMPLSPLAQLHVARRWARKVPQPTRVEAPQHRTESRERLRVGFASSDLRSHPMTNLMLEFWERIDRRRIETFAYGISVRDEGPVGQRVERALEHFVDVSEEPVERIAQRIRADRIAILFDLNGYTQNARPAIFALRPAPIQINCIGFPGTLGASWYDYIFTDRFVLPERLTPFYSERPLYMPHAAFPSDTTRLPPGAPPARTACALPEQGFVFCCFNNAYKILPEIFAIWMRLLLDVPGSVLWLLEPNSNAKVNLCHEAVQAGVDPQRLVFAPHVAVGEHVARMATADLFLDTYPYAAHTTANDALLAGLPVLTRVGETLASRIAGSQLYAIGLGELVTESFADYEALALKLATQPAILKSYRDRLAANRHTHPLFDMTAYARDFEQAMQNLWNEHQATPP
jgi:protein O-GlcNAc transferase